VSKQHGEQNRMKVFISWSGDLSKQVAGLLAGWIEDVLQGVETWISTEDIEKGSIWFTDVRTSWPKRSLESLF
jgi:hypothetical protein